MRDRFKKILCLVLTLAAAAGLMLVRDSAAWFKTDTGDALGQKIDVKKLNFTFDGQLGSYLKYNPQDAQSFFIITDTNLIKSSTGKLTGNNFSTVDTKLRFKVEYISPVTGTAREYGRENGEVLTVTEASGWTFNTTDHYFYYSANSGVMPAYDADNDHDGVSGDAFDLLTGIKFSETALASTHFSSSTVTMTGRVVVGIQARQSDNMVWEDVTWTTLATIASAP